MALDRRGGAVRRTFSPECVDDGVPRRDLTGVEDQGGEEAALLVATYRDRPVPPADLERAEDAHLEGRGGVARPVVSAHAVILASAAGEASSELPASARTFMVGNRRRQAMTT